MQLCYYGPSDFSLVERTVLDLTRVSAVCLHVV